ncbi:G/U mismatch-specific DNA glycosylase [Spiractinospora alimapuensis]|uniref:G/U mismatch-specific DNA glycosylase n=1 Tax=Spiractinospora alimapuensis TaxID=2820884 RepID=UPI001EEA394F|nr:G/U mismatch-specific DNA glycosylase [Spiractinospora alimapuensis]QVQ52406.1 G/U mismatch-specific DNA glycosylase [Spiractinospora alimapuensis]
MARPTAEELERARDRVIPDVIAPGLDFLLCGINPGLYSAHTGHHFARPGNRFWPALYRSGLTPRLLRPEEQDRLLQWGLGVTNIARRATARADELTAEDFALGGEILRRKLREYRPRLLAVLGITAFRTTFARPGAGVGRQDLRIEDVPVWVLPSPSGLNAHWSVDAIAEEMTRMRHWLGEPDDALSRPTPQGDADVTRRPTSR